MSATLPNTCLLSRYAECINAFNFGLKWPYLPLTNHMSKKNNSSFSKITFTQVHSQPGFRKSTKQFLDLTNMLIPTMTINNNIINISLTLFYSRNDLINHSLECSLRIFHSKWTNQIFE
ncbi:uncharacterized protein LOC121388814 [Gigantopelta aegis]|uniref:uncharacterized protein LOC121373744 n=1 Tax=Gigantopelta aegis TaxID=1735272 RepID=UPI001B888E49|nr:uncharacterized protein LOC121373744 [Gigantopelta aegis]XP_041360915.1 uncharacterized protein LOC121377106 [Gigantopelta aegis]XP_041373166.1 uncharacterized protein LOC121386352 [Gigantopelta aegis]XP_041373273.1 uncharacterized protein LOC121386441 [Gigantopelta aegis]XP_041375798.1 uncharacterized protein LOC121388507 [Gigantopelta aegis]XP_041376253.1 uncharacterized protein LOC121388814 [Gigantopelta aegis]